MWGCSDMAIFDLSVLGFLLVTLAIGVSRGFIREVSSVLAWILAGVASFWDFPLLNSFARSHIDMPLVADAVAMIAVFVIAFTIISLIGTVCANLVRGTLISPVDRTLGALAGLFKGVILLGVLELFVSCFLPRTSLPPSIQNSLLKSLVDQVSDTLRQCLPESVQSQLNSLHKNLASPFPSAQPLPALEPVTDPAVTTDKVKELGELGTKPSPAADSAYTPEQTEQLNRLVEGVVPADSVSPSGTSSPTGEDDAPSEGEGQASPGDSPASFEGARAEVVAED